MSRDAAIATSCLLLALGATVGALRCLADRLLTSAAIYTVFAAGLVAAGIKFKAHWGKINFLDAANVARLHQTAHFMPLVKPLFLNDYLRARLPL